MSEAIIPSRTSLRQLPSYEKFFLDSELSASVVVPNGPAVASEAARNWRAWAVRKTILFFVSSEWFMCVEAELTVKFFGSDPKVLEAKTSTLQDVMARLARVRRYRNPSCTRPA